MAKHVINNPGGRKPLPEDQKYGKAIAVRYTQMQMVRIKRKAGSKPISIFSSCNRSSASDQGTHEGD